MRTSQAEAIGAIGRVAARLPDRTVWIGIDGFGASGKSSLAARVAAAVPRAVVVAVDDFSGPEVPEWDWTRFRSEVLLPLLGGRRAHYQRWNWRSNEAAEWHDVAPGSVVVVEGVSSIRREADVPWDLTIWVDAPRDVRLERALRRDGAQLLPRWQRDWMPSEERYAARDDPLARVDYLISGADGA